MRRNTKTMYEWRKAYRDKEELMLERGFPEVSPHEFYRDLFVLQMCKNLLIRLAVKARGSEV